MDKKSFFRGFGIGVLFAAAILGVSFVIRTSDAYVTSRARELGMVYQEDEEDVLALATGTPSSDTKEDSSEEDGAATKEPDQTDKPEATAKTKATAEPEQSPEATASPKSTSSSEEDIDTQMKKEKEKAKKSIEEEKKKLTIEVGDWSSDVADKLESLGVIENATKFDKYLNDYGYSEKISAGTYSVSIDDTYEELAKKITGN
ncbi:MAG: hypothetical protein LUH14_05020 [Clostridiaceae bacterium]|nr:hypothetical protein [Clostridiaceae bacterium]